MSEVGIRRLEINGGAVQGTLPFRLILPVTAKGYADAQIDDYGRSQGSTTSRGSRFQGKWRAGSEMGIRARFSHDRHSMVGTAGFGFWNAPWGDPTIGGFSLPQAAWFFYASPPSDIPFAETGKGRGWFAATMDASTGSALSIAPFVPAILMLNQFRPLRRRLWPFVRRRLQIGYYPIDHELRDWHEYRLIWLPDGCNFAIDGETVFRTPHSPSGPLGFVCWIDNQYLIATKRGRFKWGVLPTNVTQWIEVSDLRLQTVANYVGT